MTVTPYPLTFRPILKPKVWGGGRLARWGKSLPSGQLIGESWELADLPLSIPEGRSIIANGPWAGKSLREAIESSRRAIMGRASLSDDGGFPLLIKYLDARENLSVQVHPDARYAANHPGAHVKSEAWVVLEAEPGAVLYKGIKRGVTRADFEKHIRTGEVLGDLIVIPAKPGDCHYLPSGTVHALGAGVLVAEVQTPSDTTFRVFDWGRTERELHIDQALECVSFEDEPRLLRTEEPVRVGGLVTIPLCRTESFAIERLEGQPSSSLKIVTGGTPGSPIVWMILEGRGAITVGRADLVGFAAGTTVLLPASMKGAVARFDNDVALLQITLPGSTRGLLA